ncbi:MAG: GNAT family N-acetyltransferase [Anaeroplasmataceae bacterium]|nr:GNAT family N-acetyltransferase [Anaeroplasmataceae bacterium]
MKKSRNYKIYNNGEDFLLDNEKLIHQNKMTKIETAFFDLNAKRFFSFDKENYAFSFTSQDKKLLILKCAPYNALIYGDIDLAAEAARILAEQNVEVDNILGKNKLVESFLKSYQKIKSGTIKLIHSMSIMVLDVYKSSDTSDVFVCSSDDLEDLAECYKAFEMECFQKEKSLEEMKEMLRGREQNFYAYKIDGKIVSMASKNREVEDICAISHVYTTPCHRGNGYSKKVVSKVVEDLIENNKTPYLYVDNENPISNHLYLKIGFQYFINQSQYQFKMKE